MDQRRRLHRGLAGRCAPGTRTVRVRRAEGRVHLGLICNYSGSVGSKESIKLTEELIESSIMGVVGVWGAKGPLKAMWVGGVQVNGLLQ